MIIGKRTDYRAVLRNRKELRGIFDKEPGLTDEALAARLGCSGPTVNRARHAAGIPDTRYRRMRQRRRRGRK